MEHFSQTHISFIPMVFKWIWFLLFVGFRFWESDLQPDETPSWLAMTSACELMPVLRRLQFSMEMLAKGEIVVLVGSGDKEIVLQQRHRWTYCCGWGMDWLGFVLLLAPQHRQTAVDVLTKACFGSFGMEMVLMPDIRDTTSGCSETSVTCM